MYGLRFGLIIVVLSIFLVAASSAGITGSDDAIRRIIASNGNFGQKPSSSEIFQSYYVTAMNQFIPPPFEYQYYNHLVTWNDAHSEIDEFQQSQFERFNRTLYNRQPLAIPFNVLERGWSGLQENTFSYFVPNQM